MRRVFGSALAAVFALTVGSVSGRDDKKVSIEGTYLLVGAEMNGMALDDFITKLPEAERVIKITADKMIATKGGKEDPADYKLDTSKTPYQIDMTGKKGDKEEKMFGICKVDGDKLIICLTDSDKPADRPKEFKTATDNKTDKKMLMMMTLKKK